MDIEKVEVNVHLPTIDTNNVEVNAQFQKSPMIVKINKRAMSSKLPKRVIKVTTHNVATLVAKSKGQKKPSKKNLNLLNSNSSKSLNNHRKHAKKHICYI